MKKPVIPVLITIALILTAFTLGFFLGRNTNADDVQISIIQSSISDTLSSENTAPVLININTANVSELALLPGIGETYAQRIVDFRNKNGPFDSVEQLLKVEGIGTKRLEAFLDCVTVGG